MFQLILHCAQVIEKILPPFITSVFESPSAINQNVISHLEGQDCHRSLCPKQVELNILKNERGYWEKMHKRATEREQKLKEETEQLQARIKYLEQQLYGRKSEKKSGGSEKSDSKKPENKRPRGQQKGSNGHGRRNHDHLPIEEVFVDLPDEEKFCSCCGLPFKELGITEDSEEKVVEVRAHRRVYKRKRYAPSCQCNKHPAIITAPAPPKLFPKVSLSISIIVEIIIWKFLMQVPTNRLLKYWEQVCGLYLPPGTVGDNLKRLPPLFAPLEKAIIEKCRKDNHWHCDETGWRVFSDEVANQRWYLWVFHSKSAAVYILDPGRSSVVPKSFFGSAAKGIISADRYVAYKILMKDGRFLIAYCWDHTRRDFLDFAKKYPKMEAWGLDWKTDIGKLYHLNDQRLRLPPASYEYAEANGALHEAIENMERKCDKELCEPRLHGAKQKILESLKNHWSGLTLFVTRPWIPMSNAEAERKMRNPVIGRKNYYGSGSIGSGFLMATMLTILQTLLLWNTNPTAWLTAYLEACAKAGGVPPDFEKFLPWNMSDEMRETLSLKTCHKTSKSCKERSPI